MDNIFLLALIGFLIGASGTLIGAGGGFILVPLLLITHPKMPAATTTAISIAVVAANAISGSIAYARSRRIDYKAGLLFGAFTIPGSIFGVLLIKYVPKHIFDIVFGILLVILATYLFIKTKKRNDVEQVNHSINTPGLVTHHITDREGDTFNYSFNSLLGIIISIVVGFISPLLGIGGGIIHVPAMVQWLKFPVHIATATSHFILAIMTTVSVIVHFSQGSYHDPRIQFVILGLCIGVIPGAQFGAFISNKIKSKLIIKILAVCLCIAGLRILFLTMN